MSLHARLRGAHRSQPVRFLLAGGLAAGVNWVVRFPLSLVLPFAAAVFIAALIGMVIGFTAYRAFVFPGSTRPAIRQVPDFLAVNVAGTAVTTLTAVIFEPALASVLATAPAQALAHAGGIAAGALANFHGHRRITFRQS